METLKLMADYYCYPLWYASDGKFGDININNLPISETLKRELLEWADQYDSTLNQEYPPDSGFKTPIAEKKFKEKGEELAHRLQKELSGKYHIIYNK